MLVEQEFNSNHCGHACLSMVTGDTKEEIINKLQNTGELSLQKEVMWYLHEKGYKTRVITSFNIKKEDIPDNSIVRLEDINNKGHFVLLKDNVFLDPNVGKVLSYISRKRITHYLEII